MRRPEQSAHSAIAAVVVASVSLFAVSSAGGSPTAQIAACTAAQVHYIAYKTSPPALRNTPWVAASPSTSMLVGHVLYWRSTVWGKQADSKTPFHIYIGGRAPGNGVHMKILWALRAGSASRLKVQGTRLGRPGQFTQTFPGGHEFPSIVKIPTAGCWKLTLTAGSHTGRLTVTAVAR
jgi:hypothetical protein